ARGRAAVCLVLRDELRRVTGRTVRSTEAEIADVRNVEPRLLGETPHARHAAERRPTVARAEQRRPVVTVGTVEDVAVLVLGIRAGEEAHALDRLVAREHLELGAGVGERE